MLMTMFAFFGLVGNGVVIWLRRKDSKDNINIWGGLLHAILDTLGSLGLLVGSGYIIFTQQFVADGAVTIGIAALTLGGAVWIIKKAWRMLR